MSRARGVIALTAMALLSIAHGFAFAGKPTDQKLNRNVTLPGGYTLQRPLPLDPT